MSKRKKQPASEYVYGTVSEPGDPSVIHYLAVRMNDLQDQACAADSDETPGSARRYRLLSDEADFLREKIFKEQPRTLADVAIQSLLAFGEIDLDGRIEDGDEMSAISWVRAALFRQIRYFMDTPEVAAKPAAEAA